MKNKTQSPVPPESSVASADAQQESTSETVQTSSPENNTTTTPSSNTRSNNKQKTLSHSAQKRRARFLKAQTAARDKERLHKRRMKLQKGVLSGVQTVGKSVLSLGKVLQKANIGGHHKEEEQQTAPEQKTTLTQHERFLLQHAEEQERLRICAEAHDACMAAVRHHLDDFLQEHPFCSCYEEWIMELHPDNVLDDLLTIDERFYVEGSDHRILWNQAIMRVYQIAAEEVEDAAGMQSRLVPARIFHGN